MNRSHGSPAATDRDGNSRSSLDDSTEEWRAIPQLFRASSDPLPAPWEDIFGPLRAGAVDDLVVVGQIGQSLDGRVATANGRSRYINGAAGLKHLHRLRALVDAVVVGVGSALADDPQLTVRRVAGPDPARVVIDPGGRLTPAARLFAADGARRIVVRGEGAGPPPAGVEAIVLPAPGGRIAPAAILAALAQTGLRRVLIEGGADTLSGFLAANCLDRLHVVVAPIILGGGRAGLSLDPIVDVGEALRPEVNVHGLGDEVLFDCSFAARRTLLGRAKKSV